MPTDKALTVYVDLLNVDEVKSMLQDAATEISALCSILRAWDAWLLTDRQDDALLAETADRTAAFFGTNRGALLPTTQRGDDRG